MPRVLGFLQVRALLVAIGGVVVEPIVGVEVDVPMLTCVISGVAEPNTVLPVSAAC
jgi:hypothetical protein